MSCSRRLFLFVIPLLCLVGCAGRAGESGAAAPEALSEIGLVVENHHWNDVIVYLVHDGVADRIGLAIAVKTSTFILPSRRLGIAGVIQLRGHPVGAPGDYTTESLTVRPGQEIQWTLESDLTRSSVAVH